MRNMAIKGGYMIFRNQGFQFVDGTYYEKKTSQQGEPFRFEILVDQRKSYGQIINNLIATQGRVTIKTNYNLDFKISGYVVFKNGRKFLISDIVEMEQEINPQTLYWFKENPNTDLVLSLVEVENVEEKI